MIAEGVYSYTAPTKGTQYASHYTTMMVTVHRSETAANVIQVVPVTKSSIVMLSRSGVPHFAELADFAIAAINAFHERGLRIVLARMSEQWNAEDAMRQQATHQ